MCRGLYEVGVKLQQSVYRGYILLIIIYLEESQRRIVPLIRGRDCQPYDYAMPYITRQVLYFVIQPCLPLTVVHFAMTAEGNAPPGCSHRVIDECFAAWY